MDLGPGPSGPVWVFFFTLSLVVFLVVVVEGLRHCGHGDDAIQTRILGGAGTGGCSGARKLMFGRGFDLCWWESFTSEVWSLVCIVFS